MSFTDDEGFYFDEDMLRDDTDKEVQQDSEIRRLKQELRMCQDRIAKLDKDRQRLNYLDSTTKGYGKGWVLRDSATGHGMRLHETSEQTAHPTVRQAIDAHRAANSN